MAKYPEQTKKVLNENGHVPMRDQMAHGARPHTHFQETSAPGTRGSAGINMSDGGVVPTAMGGNTAAPGVKAKGGGNPITAAAGSARSGSTQGVPGVRGSAAGVTRGVGNIANAGHGKK